MRRPLVTISDKPLARRSEASPHSWRGSAVTVIALSGLRRSVADDRDGQGRGPSQPAVDRRADGTAVKADCASASYAGDVGGPAKTRRCSLLIVDDEVLVLRALARALCQEYDLTTLSSPEEALICLSRGSWDIILSDVMMPEMDGVELSRRAQHLRVASSS